MAQIPQSDQMRVRGSGRRKVALQPGRSQLDWVRNSTSLPRHPSRSINLSELRKHNKPHDVWLAINGVVFDVTPYVEYHPGGVDKILAGAGKDATDLFNKFHAWVNPHFMLSRCILGPLVVDEQSKSKSDDDESDESDESDQDDNKDDNKSKHTSKSSNQDTTASQSSSTVKDSNSDLVERIDQLNFAEIQE